MSGKRRYAGEGRGASTASSTRRIRLPSRIACEQLSTPCAVPKCPIGRFGTAQAAVQVGDIDFLRRSIDVRRQVQRASKREVEIRPPKYGSERTVYIPPGLVTILSQHVAARGIGQSPDAWLFKGENGNPPHQNTVGYWWRQARTKAKLDTLRLHDLRHYYASGLIADGCDVVTVQRALGHKSATTTLNTYSHLWPSAEDRTRAAAGRMLTAALVDVYPSCTEEASDAT